MTVGNGMLILAAVLLFSALLTLWLAHRRRAAIGLPAGRVIYSDTRLWGKVEQPLYDSDLGLVGKPDYLVKSDDQIIPVEVKTGKISGAPYDTHIFQLAAYCLLVHHQFDKRPSHGILHYPNRTFAIEYTEKLELTLIDMIQEIHRKGKHKELHRSHESAARCNRCGYRDVCDQKLL